MKAVFSVTHSSGEQQFVSSQFYQESAISYELHLDCGLRKIVKKCKKSIIYRINLRQCGKKLV